VIKATDIHSLTDFTRNAKRYISYVKETRSPLAITVNGDAEVVVQDAQSYQQMIDELEQIRFIEAIRESEKAAAEGRMKDQETAFADIRKKLAL
jgi:prevent-host-death family protein